MLGMRFVGSAAVLSLCGALGCSSDPPPGSQTDGIGNAGSGNGSNGSGNAGGPSIITDPGSTADAGTGTPDCNSILDVVYRDFSESHPDFEMKFQGDVVRRGLIESTLGSDQKPVFKDRIGHPPLAGSPTAINTDWQPMEPVIASADSFKQWYTSTDGINLPFFKKLPLSEATPGVFGFESDMFFPLTPTEGFGITPKANNSQGRNFLFTTEVHVLFKYTGGQKFTFRGDDDLWIFVNRKLALDLGSMHNVEEGTIDFDAQAAALGIAVGVDYEMDIFHAERHTSASNFKITTNIACFTPAIIK